MIYFNVALQISQSRK